MSRFIWKLSKKQQYALYCRLDQAACRAVCVAQNKHELQQFRISSYPINSWNLEASCFTLISKGSSLSLLNHVCQTPKLFSHGSKIPKPPQCIAPSFAVPLISGLARKSACLRSRCSSMIATGDFVAERSSAKPTTRDCRLVFTSWSPLLWQTWHGRAYALYRTSKSSPLAPRHK